MKFFAVSLAWQLARIVGAAHSSARGGFLCATAVLRQAKLLGVVPLRLSLASDLAPYKGKDATGRLFGFYADEIFGFFLFFLGKHRR